MRACAVFGVFVCRCSSLWCHRVCDIWRGYWAERLLWEVGGQLTFVPPSVFQARNPHNLEADLDDEVKLYTDAGRLVRFLVGWKPKSGSLAEMAVELAQGMAELDFWGQGDVNLVKAWVTVRATPSSPGHPQPKIQIITYPFAPSQG
jgi:hypothetical protein